MNALATAWILFLMAIVVADISGRELFGAPIAGVPEIVKLSIVGIVFLQIGHTHGAGRMIRSDSLLVAAGKRWPAVKTALDIAADLLGIAFCTVLVQAVWPRFLKVWERGEFEGAVGHFTIPVWPFYLIIVCGTAVLALSFAVNLARIIVGVNGKISDKGGF